MSSFHYAELFHDAEHKKSWLKGWKTFFSRYYRMAGENVPRKEAPTMPKMVINSCWGGFGLSPAAHARLGSVYVKSDDAEYGVGYWDTSSWNQGLDQDGPEFRSLPALVEVVELLCDEASGSYSRLRVVDVPDDAEVYISEYDGRETVREVHRSWG